MVNKRDPYSEEPSRGENGYHLVNYKIFAQKYWLNHNAKFGQSTNNPDYGQTEYV